MKILVVRHAECHKNLIGIPGGEGAPLTPVGSIQAAELGNLLLPRLAGETVLIASPTLQTVETAAIVGDLLGIKPEVEPLFKSIDLGVLSGVSIAEARVRFPTSSASMDKWRSNSSEIADLQIEGMECPWAFYNRGLRGVLKYKECNLLILCATTSLMILMSHISRKITPRSGDRYKSISFANTELLSIELDDGHLDWCKALLPE